MLQALLDQRQSGKQLLLITNSDYHYTHRMMSFAYDCFLPEGQTWRDLFDMVSVVWDMGCGLMVGVSGVVAGAGVAGTRAEDAGGRPGGTSSTW